MAGGLLVCALAGPATAAHGQLVSESFQGTTAPGWILGGDAELTAAEGIDPDGDGWLRLTPAVSNRTGYAYFDTPVPTTQGLSIDFEYAMWGGDGADGISFFMFDGAAPTFSAGTFGASLGYAQDTANGQPGMSSGYFGLGIDLWGGYSNIDRHEGGTASTPNAIALRGPGNGLTGYAYLAGTAALTPGVGTGGRPASQTDPNYRSVLIDLVPVGGGYRILVRLQRGSTIEPILDHVIANPPPTLKFGFAGSTGRVKNNHEVRLVKVTQPLDLNLTKSLSSLVGTTIAYSLRAWNDGPNADPAAHVVDLPSGLANISWQCVASNGGGCASPTGTGGLDTTANLPSGASVVYTITGTITALATSPLVNTATVTPSPALTDINPANNTASVSQQLKTDLQISKTAPPAYTPGLSHVYQVEVRNPSPFTVRGAKVSDAVPPRLPFVWSCQVITPPAICNATPTTRPFEDTVDLGAGAIVRYTLAVSIPADHGDTLTNVATVGLPVGWVDEAPANNKASVTSMAGAEADLRVTKSGSPNPYIAGQSLTYTIVVGNDGPSDVVSARVQDVVPPELAGASWTCTSSGGGACGPTSGTGNIDQLLTLPAGGSVSYTLVGTVPTGATSPIMNTVTVTPPTGVADPVPGNNSAAATSPPLPRADLTISKSASPDPFLPGQPLTYRLIVTNLGPEDAAGARVQDVLPAGLAATATWTCVTSPSGSCATPAGTGSVDALVTLPSGSAATFTITAAVPAGTDTLVNTATVTAPASVTDPVPGNNTARSVGRASVSADLRIAKSSTPNPYVAGAALTYTVTVHNDGPGDVVNARVMDVPPADLSDVAWSCTSTMGSCAPATGSGHIDAFVTLPAGALATFTIDAVAPPTSATALLNVATVSPPFTVVDPVPANNEAVDTNPLVPAVNLVLTQTGTPNPYVPGHPLTYTIAVNNGGPAAALGARVRVPLESALSGFTWTCTGTGGGATCGMPAGAGAIDAMVDLPVPGASVQFVVTGIVDARETDPVTNVAGVAPPRERTDSHPQDNLATLTIPGVALPDLGIVKTAVPVATYRPGEPLTYSIAVTNHGSAAAPGGGYTILENLPPELNGVSWTCTVAPSGVCGVSGGVLLTAALPLLGPGETMVVTLQTVVPAEVTDPLRNSATVLLTAPGLTDPNTANDGTILWLLPSPLASAAIVGHVVDDDGAPLTGVVIQLTGAASLQATTTADGAYAFRGLAPGHRYEVSATSADRVFTPPAHVFEALDGIEKADFVGVGQPYTRYYAEGSTGPFFTTTFSVTNPAPIPAAVDFRFQRPEASEITFGFVLAPRQSLVLDPSTLPGLESTAFSTVIASQHQIFTAREMHWDRSNYGTHRGVGVTMPRTHWFVAEGATLPRFSLFYLLQNPGNTAATVAIRYLLQADGTTPVVRTYLVESRSRYTVAVHDDPALVNQELAAEISSDVPIVVDRAMYFSGPRLFEAGAAVTAVPTPSTTWYFSEGATGQFFDMFLLLANPNPVSVTATVRFVLPDGREALTRQYDVPAGLRRSVWIDQVDPVLADAAVGMVVEATGPIVAERSMWWPGSSDTWNAGHASQGATTAAIKWGIGGLVAGGDSNAEPWILVANPIKRSTTVRLTLYFPDGRAPVTADYFVAAESRLTIPVGDWHPQTADSPFGAVVEQLDATTGIVVESAVYFDSGGVTWAAGRGGIATPIP